MERLVDVDPIRIRNERDRYLVALDDILNGRGDPVEVARKALRGK